MAELQHIAHPLDPVYDKHSRVLILGSMPSPQSRETGFYYGNPRNRFWDVLSHICREPTPSTNDRKRVFCLRHHLALWDVLAECDIEGASDSSIVNPKPNDLASITRNAPIDAVFCTGAKAYELYTRYCADEVGIEAVQLPSTSPANAACSFESLVREYIPIFMNRQTERSYTLPVNEVVELEQKIARDGTSLAELMDRAGEAVAWRALGILEEMAAGAYPRLRGRPRAADNAASDFPLIVLLCGSGNNGGDGWVAARELAERGIAVCVVCAKLPADLSAQPAHDVAAEAYDALVGNGRGRTISCEDEDAVEELLRAEAAVADGSSPRRFSEFAKATPLVYVCNRCAAEAERLLRRILSHAALVVDAILGTGAKSAPRAPYSRWIAAERSTRKTHAMLSVDVPTGMDADTGEIFNGHITADETVTMIVNKPGLCQRNCGRLTIAPLVYLAPFMEDR